MTSKEIADSLREEVRRLQELIRVIDPPRQGRPPKKVTSLEERRSSQ